MDEYNRVPIRYTAYPDFQTVVNEKTSYSDKINYYIVSLVKSESMLVQQSCDESGILQAYSEPTYYSCRIKDDHIEVLNEKDGWIPAKQQLNQAYRDFLANKVLVE